MIKRFIRKLLDFEVLVHYTKWRHKILQLLGQPTFIVYTMGKVGSTSLYIALKKKFPLVYHVHCLNNDTLEELKTIYNQAGFYEPKKIHFINLLKGNFHHLTGSYAIIKNRPKENWILISIVRDPIDTYFSKIFQNPKVYRPYLLSNDGYLDPKKVQKNINENVLNYDPKTDDIANWFSTEFKQYTDINIYDHSFDYKKGYVIIESTFKIIIITLSKLESKINEALSKVLGRNINLEIEKLNVGNTKKNGGTYSLVKKKVVFDHSYLKKVYSTKFATHFFDEETRKSKIEYWNSPRSKFR